MPKIYRTFQGEKIDIEALFRKHELTQAVGNMRTNARGDELGPGGAIVKTREQKAKEYYQRQKAAKKAVEQAAKASAATATTAPVEEPKIEALAPKPSATVKAKNQKTILPNNDEDFE